MNYVRSSRSCIYDGDADSIELYVGLMVEHGLGRGTGLPLTLGFAVTMDALASVSQDRFYTTDMIADHYSEWGLGHARRTVLTDIINRHTSVQLDRNMKLEHVPEHTYSDIDAEDSVHAYRKLISIELDW